MLLLEALARCDEQTDKDFGDVSASSLRRIMRNDDYNGPDRHKLRLSDDDHSVFIDLMEGEERDSDSQSKIRKSFDFFRKKIEQLEDEKAKWFSKGLLGLQVVSILLNNDDDPQHVFESMNSKGNPLSASDLARNYILMKPSHKEQKELHGRYWRPIEINLQFDEEANLLEPFIRDYLLHKKGKSVGQGPRRIYKEFQERFQESECSEAEFLKDMRTHSDSYASFIFPGKIQNAELSRAFEDWRGFARESSTPLMMSLYACFRDRCFNEKEFCQIIRLIESFSFRRWVCNQPHNARNAVFMDLIQKINGREEFKDGYFAGLVKYFRAQEGRRCFPVDEDFENSLPGIDIYGTSCRYVLGKLENHGREERSELDSNITIEHIMPQTLTSEWEKMLGENHEEVHLRFLHKLGNLTLTGHDPRLSNDPFLVKKDKGYKGSSFRLNEYVRQAEKWTQEEIEERGKILAARAVEVWALPEVK